MPSGVECDLGIGCQMEMGSQRRSGCDRRMLTNLSPSTCILSNNFSYQSHSLRLYRCAAISSGADRDPPMATAVKERPIQRL